MSSLRTPVFLATAITEAAGRLSLRPSTGSFFFFLMSLFSRKAGTAGYPRRKSGVTIHWPRAFGQTLDKNA